VKAGAYRANFGDAAEHFHLGDVWQVEPGALPGQADLAWASSPCQDFSLAGGRAGLKGGVRAPSSASGGWSRPWPSKAARPARWWSRTSSAC